MIYVLASYTSLIFVFFDFVLHLLTQNKHDIQTYCEEVLVERATTMAQKAEIVSSRSVDPIKKKYISFMNSVL